MVYNDFLEYNLTGVTKNLFTSLYSFHFESKKRRQKTIYRTVHEIPVHYKGEF